MGIAQTDGWTAQFFNEQGLFFKGTRIGVSLLLDALADGMTIEDLLKEYPHLQREDVLAAMAYGAEMSRERYVDVPMEALA